MVEDESSEKKSRASNCPSFIAAVIRRGRAFQCRRKGRRSVARSRDADNLYCTWPCPLIAIEIGIPSTLSSLYTRQPSTCPEIPSSASSGSRARASPARSIR